MKTVPRARTLAHTALDVVFFFQPPQVLWGISIRPCPKRLFPFLLLQSYALNIHQKLQKNCSKFVVFARLLPRYLHLFLHTFSLNSLCVPLAFNVHSAKRPPPPPPPPLEFRETQPRCVPVSIPLRSLWHVPCVPSYVE